MPKWNNLGIHWAVGFFGPFLGVTFVYVWLIQVFQLRRWFLVQELQVYWQFLHPKI